MDLLMEIETYLHRTGVSPTAFGRRAVNDPRLVLDMRRGRRPKPHTIERVTAILHPGARGELRP